MLMLNHLTGFCGSVSTPRIVNTDHAVNTSDLSLYTFSARSFGSEATGKKLVLGVYIAAVVSPGISSVTVDGNAASLVVGLTTTNTRVALYDISFSGSSGAVEVTPSSASACCGIGIWALYDLQSMTATDTGSSSANPGSDTLNISAGGVAVGYAAAANVVSTYTWSNLSEAAGFGFDETIDAGAAGSHSGASASFASQQTGLSITATYSAGAQHSMLLASYR